jgi:hypothetical protein
MPNKLTITVAITKKVGQALGTTHSPLTVTRISKLSATEIIGS